MIRGNIDTARIVAGRVLLSGWLVPGEEPTHARVDGGEAELIAFVRVARPEQAAAIGRGDLADRLGFVAALDAARLPHTPTGAAAAVSLHGWGGIHLLSGEVPIRPVATEDIRVAGSDREAVFGALDAGAFPPAVEAALRWTDDPGRSAIETEAHVDFAVPVGGGSIVGLWLRNAADRRLMFLSTGLEMVVESGDMAFFAREDVGALLAAGGHAVSTVLHGITAVFPYVHPATRGFHVFEVVDGRPRHIRTLDLTRAHDAEIALSAFWQHWGRGRFPPPERVERSLRPLLAPARPEPRSDTQVIRDGTGARLSAIVPLYGRPFFIRSLLHNQRAYPDGTEFVYVSDDPTQHGFIEGYLADRAALAVHPTRLVLNRSNYGYSASNNVGVGEARGEVLLFQNSDVWLEDGRAIGDGLAMLEGDRFGIVGFRLLYEDGTLQHDGMTFEPGGFVHGLHLAEHPGKGLPPVETESGEVRAVTGAMMMMRRAWFDEIGGFDPGYVRGDFEDADLCLRSAGRGRAVGIVRTGRIRHLERQSIPSGADLTSPKAITYLNCIRFNRLWADALAGVAA